jgi:CRP-like cAMP-binding protein
MSAENLRNVRILSGMTDAQLEALLPHGNVLQFAPGKHIIKQSDKADSLYLLLEGEAAAYITDRLGHETHLRTMDSGGHFGEIGVLQGGTRTANVRAVTDCTVFQLEASAFQGVLEDPDLAVPFLHGLSRSLAIRLTDISNRFSELHSLKDAWMV